MTTEEKLIEDIAKVLYHSDGGFDDEDYFAATGKKRGEWSTLAQ